MTATSRAGVTLAELIVALVVGLLVLQVALFTLARFRVVGLDLASRADALVALRVGRHVLRRELRNGVPDRDWSATPDSISIRAFRGTALICSADSTAAELVVSYRGDRGPDPSKDSVLLTADDGASVERALAGIATAPSACDAPGITQRWRLDAAAPAGVVVARLFESGSYHLRDAALRYRRGASGRQPLTPEVWSGASAWRVGSERLSVDFVPSTDASDAWTGFLAWRVPQ